jgi:hypothetical protein
MRSNPDAVQTVSAWVVMLGRVTFENTSRSRCRSSRFESAHTRPLVVRSAGEGSCTPGQIPVIYFGGRGSAPDPDSLRAMVIRRQPLSIAASCDRDKRSIKFARISSA